MTVMFISGHKNTSRAQLKMSKQDDAAAIKKANATLNCIKNHNIQITVSKIVIAL